MIEIHVYSETGGRFSVKDMFGGHIIDTYGSIFLRDIPPSPQYACVYINNAFTDFDVYIDRVPAPDGTYCAPQTIPCRGKSPNSVVEVVFQCFGNYGTLSLTTNADPGASIVSDIDGNLGLTPIISKHITPGNHTITISKTGWTTKYFSFSIPAGGARAEYITMNPVPVEYGDLYVTSFPSSAFIWIHGSDTGFQTPHNFTDLIPGTYEITLKSLQYEDKTLNVTVVANASNTFDFGNLIPKVGYGSIRITGTAGAHIALAPHGDTGEIIPHTITEIVAGVPFDITCSLQGYQSMTKAVTAIKDQTVVVDFTLPLIPQKGSLEVTSTPHLSDIYFNGTDTNQKTPNTFTFLDPGEYFVTVKNKPDWDDMTKNIMVNPGENSLDFQLKPAGSAVGSGEDYSRLVIAALIAGGAYVVIKRKKK